VCEVICVLGWEDGRGEIKRRSGSERWDYSRVLRLEAQRMAGAMVDGLRFVPNTCLFPLLRVNVTHTGLE